MRTKMTLLSMGLLLVVPMRSWSGSDGKESLAPIAVDPRATLTMRYPGDDYLPQDEYGPRARPDIAVVEGQRVPIIRLPDGSCPRITVELQAYPEEPPLQFEDDGRHLWSPASSSQTSESIDQERCEVVIDEATAQIQWQRIAIRRPNVRERKRLEDMGLKMPVDPTHAIRTGSDGTGE